LKSESDASREKAGLFLKLGLKGKPKTIRAFKCCQILFFLGLCWQASSSLSASDLLLAKSGERADVVEGPSGTSSYTVYEAIKTSRLRRRGLF